MGDDDNVEGKLGGLDFDAPIGWMGRGNDCSAAVMIGLVVGVIGDVVVEVL